MPEEAESPSGRFFNASDFGRLASWRTVELSATSAAVDRMFGKSVCPDESIGSNTLQDHCKITARNSVAISFIAGYARPASPKAIFYFQ